MDPMDLVSPFIPFIDITSFLFNGKWFGTYFLSITLHDAPLSIMKLMSLLKIANIDFGEEFTFC